MNSTGSQMLMRIKNGTTNYYVYGATGLIYESDETATTTNTAFYHFDTRGSTIALTDKNGNLTDQIEYSPYGATTYRAGTNDTPFCYNGRLGVQTEPNGLLYMRARYYNPLLCRFLNPDPTGFSGGFNFYAFAAGNPVNNVDPMGLQASWMGAGFGTLSGPLSGGLSAGYSMPANYTTPNPSGTGVILFDSGVSFFALGGGGAGTQSILLGNGQLVSYGYVAVGAGLGGAGGNFGLGQVYNVFQPIDYSGNFVNVSAGLGVSGASISSWPGGSASYTAGASTTGVSGTYQYYWIISASDPVISQSPSASRGGTSEPSQSSQIGQSSPTGK